jgi:3-phenylpropionate/trans-cinnamate dioxygenase ferredoxin reductase subunit
LLLRPQAFYAEQDIEVRTGIASTQLDCAEKIVTFADGTAERYDKLLIATGARVRKLTLPGSDLSGIFYLRSIGDVDLIRPQIKAGARIVLIGGGYIGLEVAAVAARQGAQVTVIEMASRLMARTASEPVSLFYEREHRSNGVAIKLDAMCDGFEGEVGQLARVRLADGSTVAADIAIVGIGVEPEIGIARDAGIVCDNGILVDAFGRTSDPDVFAAGDCTNHPNPFAGGMIRLESVQNAIDQAKHAALAMLGKPTPYGEVPWFWSDQYDLKLQSAGIPRGHDEVVMRGDPAQRSFAVFYCRKGQVLAVEAINAVPEFMFGKRMIAERKQATPAQLADMNVTMREIAMT